MIDKTRADLEEASRENIEFIIDYIKSSLKVVNAAAINPKSFDTDHYDDLLDLYEYMSKKDRFTMSEMESIITEIGNIRKK